MQPRDHSRRRPSAALTCLAVVVALLSSCAGDVGEIDFSVPTTGTPDARPPSAFVGDIERIDTRNVLLSPVTGKPQPVEPVDVFIDDRIDGDNDGDDDGGGEGDDDAEKVEPSNLEGRVTHNGTPVAGATVRLERFVAGQVGFADVQTDEDGIFVAKKIHGGRYRLRAWKAPGLVNETAAAVFLHEGETKNDVELPLVGVLSSENVAILANLEVPRPVVGQEVELRLTITTQTFDASGAVTVDPVDNVAVTITRSDLWTVVSDVNTTSDDRGVAVFDMLCTSAGSFSITVQVSELPKEVSLPACITPEEAAASTSGTTAVDGPGTIGPNGLPRTVSIPVGGTFTVPFAGPVDPGTFASVVRGNSPKDACSTSYERWVNGKWETTQQVANGGTLTLTAISRDFKAVAGTTACTYERRS